MKAFGDQEINYKIDSWKLGELHLGIYKIYVSFSEGTRWCWVGVQSDKILDASCLKSIAIVMLRGAMGIDGLSKLQIVPFVLFFKQSYWLTALTFIHGSIPIKVLSNVAFSFKSHLQGSLNFDLESSMHDCPGESAFRRCSVSATATSVSITVSISNTFRRDASFFAIKKRKKNDFKYHYSYTDFIKVRRILI